MKLRLLICPIPLFLAIVIVWPVFAGHRNRRILRSNASSRPRIRLLRIRKLCPSCRHLKRLLTK